MIFILVVGKKLAAFCVLGEYTKIRLLLCTHNEILAYILAYFWQKKKIYKSKYIIQDRIEFRKNYTSRYFLFKKTLLCSIWIFVICIQVYTYLNTWSIVSILVFMYLVECKTQWTQKVCRPQNLLQNLRKSIYTDFFVTNRNCSRDHKLGFKKLCDFLKKILET